VSAGVKLGGIPGTYQVKLKFGEQSTSFNVTVQVDLASLTIVSGNDNPVVDAGQQFTKPLVVQVKDTSGAGVPNTVVNWTLISGSATLSATTTTTDAQGMAQIQVVAGATPGAIQVNASVPGLSAASFVLTSKAPPPPKPPVDAGSFTNFVTGQAGVTPGGLVLLRGRGLARNITAPLIANPQLATLPTKLGGVTVGFGSSSNLVLAPIYWVMPVAGGEDVVLLQVPFEVNSTAATTPVTVQVDGMDSLTVNDVKVSVLSPGILENVDIAGRKYAVAMRADGSIINPASGVKRGTRIRLWAIGLGQTGPLASTNRIGLANQTVLGKVVIGLDQWGFDVVSAALAPNLIGVYEIVVDVPTTVQTGTYRSLSISVEDAAHNRYFSQTTSLNIIE
jgi:uncharacterized protein (TIGR03437 family)